MRHSTKLLRTLFAGCLILLMGVLSGCSSSGGEPLDEFEPLDFDSFVDGKEDTGYLSNKAAELEARLTSSIYIDMSGQSADAIQAKADSLRTASRWTLQSHTSPQLKYARNTLKSEELDMNLERGEPTVLQVRTDANGVWLDFSTAIESLVKFKDLEEKNLTPADLVGKRIELKMPSMPQGVFDKGGVACATDPDGDDLHEEDLRADNYFYYFDPAKQGCPLQDGVDLVDATYEIISSLDTHSVYPEYDLLTQDKLISMVALFGQITHGDLEDNDWGWIAYKDFKRDFTRNGFQVVETFADNFGERLEKTYSGGLTVTVNFYTPEALKDHRPRAEVNELFVKAIHDHEIVYYNGHAFYGSLTVLGQPEAYPQETYQIINMDACWSYAYYTKQVFENKIGDSDPDGMKYVDVVNNTEPGITGSQKTAFLLYKNIFQASSELMQGQAPNKYSWNNLIVYMNDSADKRARYYDPEKFHAEIYGASGVTGNCFNPNGPSNCQIDPGTNRTHSYEDAAAVDIPDNDANGISRDIEVPDGFNLESVQVQIDLQHTYIGDLRISLSHNGTEVGIHENTGGGSDDIRSTFGVSGFQGSASGTWTLKVVDSANYDTGSLNSWTLILTEPGDPQQAVSGENNTSQPIPDNDPAGITSTINIADSVTIGDVQVQVNITHTYIGDLKVTLQHAGLSQVLHDRSGGSAENLVTTFTGATFAAGNSSGDWTLEVSDNAGADTGTLNSWSLTINP